MRIAEVADYLGVSRSKVYQLMGEGELPWVKLGRLRRIPRTQLIEMMERHTFIAVSSNE